MGFLEYAWSQFFEKDQLKTKLLVSPKNQSPQLFRDETGYVCIFPEPTVEESEEEKTISLMGYRFPADAQGKRQLTSLFRAAVFHCGAHVVCPSFEDYEEWRKDKNSRLAKFTASLIEDTLANSYIIAKHSDKLVDIAFANTLALKRLRLINNLINPATKIMAGLLIRINTGLMKIEPKNEHEVVTRLAELVRGVKEKALLSFTDVSVTLKDEALRVADEIYNTIENAGPITEAPFLPHTEKLGVCSIFSPSYFVNEDINLENDFKECLNFLGGTISSSESEDQTSRKIAEAQAMQVFDSWEHQKDKDKEIISRHENILVDTRFRAVEIPPPDYTNFSRIKIECKSEAHRLIESLLVARDAIDEDPRKMYGVLDLQDMIQVVASKSPRMDVFMLDENISKSYSWIVLLDASRSMNCVKDFALELYVMLAEVANELLLDPSSWGMYAFNDRLLVIKDLKERYNVRVKARIGGLEFEGFTFMSDALEVAGKVIKTRAENLRLITVISDGFPFGYPNIDVALRETLSSLEKRNISVIGVGAKSRRVESFFRSHCIVNTPRDLSKKFSNLYLGASRIAVET